MKRILCGGLVALGLALTAAPAKADCYFCSTCCRNITFVRTCRNRCWSFNSYCNPLPCVGSCGYGYSGPAPWNALAAYGPYGYPPRPAPVAAVPAAPAPAATPGFKAPAPTPATNSTAAVQQAGYFHYGQFNNAGSAYNYGTNYGYGYYGYGANYSYAQAPNYWY